LYGQIWALKAVSLTSPLIVTVTVHILDVLLKCVYINYRVSVFM